MDLALKSSSEYKESQTNFRHVYDSELNSGLIQKRMFFAWIMSWIDSISEEATGVMSWMDANVWHVELIRLKEY